MTPCYEKWKRCHWFNKYLIDIVCLCFISVVSIAAVSSHGRTWVIFLDYNAKFLHGVDIVLSSDVILILSIYYLSNWVFAVFNFCMFYSSWDFEVCCTTFLCPLFVFIPVPRIFPFTTSFDKNIYSSLHYFILYAKIGTANTLFESSINHIRSGVLNYFRFVFVCVMGTCTLYITAAIFSPEAFV